MIKNSMFRFQIFSLVVLTLFTGAFAQKFYPDDPITKDEDSMAIEKPMFVDLSPTFDMAENTFGPKISPLSRAQGVNTLGEVPDSSWFTNRIGIQDLSIEELLKGGDVTGGPDLSHPLTVIGSSLTAITEGLAVRDSRGDYYYLIFDRKGYPNLATGAGIIGAKFFYAMGYNALPAYIVQVDPNDFELDPTATVVLLGGEQKPLDQEYIDLYKDEIEGNDDGTYRALAYWIPPGENVGPFKFYGTRPDDPNDVFPHENRRELRGLQIFSAWLNHYLSVSPKTRDWYVTEGNNSFVKHYLVDFTTSLGSGYDLDDQIIPKDEQSGNEHLLVGDLNHTLKTAATLGIWERPWMKVDYPYPQYAEIGRFSGEHFDPVEWKTIYPNVAFNQMFADDAFWATKIVARFSDDAIRAIVKTGEFADPEAERFLADALIQRRDKIISHYYKQLNPLDGFTANGSNLKFRNLGAEKQLAQDCVYEYHWYTFDNMKQESTPLGTRMYTMDLSIPIPLSLAEYLMVRIRTRTQQARHWKKSIEVFLRNPAKREVVGIDREVGMPALDLLGRQTGQTAATVEFGGTFGNLESEQQLLIDDWVARYNQVTNRNLTAEELYDGLPLSYRTTFEAATNALMETALSDENGEEFGVALDLVDRLEAIHGRIEGAGGDEQFRIYIELKPDAIEMMERSREFKRGADNTVYHKGYPLNYRQQTSPPSMQVSVARDKIQADIDVDYRSSKFPSALINGHLTAANSDVRAGNNHQRHTSRWEGFQDWWRGLFGLPLIGTPYIEEFADSEFIFPEAPRAGQGKIEEAASDFLKAWFVEQEPRQAIAYISKQAIPCMAPVPGEERQDISMAPFLMMERMKSANLAMGKVESLEDILVGIRLTHPRLRVVDQPYHSQFVTFDVPEDLALEFDCSRRNDPEPEAHGGSTDRYGKYFGTVFSLKTPKGQSGTTILLWTKEEKNWKIVSYEVDPGLQEASIPDLRAAAQAVPLTRIAGDPEFVTANFQFLKAWFVDRDFDRALNNFSPSCNKCVAQYLPEGEEVPTNAEAIRARLRFGLERIADLFKDVERPRDIVRPVELVNPDIQIIEHEYEDVFTLVSAPDYVGNQLDCSQRVEAGQTLDSPPEDKVYGNYYGAVFEIRTLGGDAATFYLVWKKEQGEWKITAYHVLTP